MTEYKRIVIDVHERFHKDIKLMSTKLGITMKHYVLDAIGKALKEDKEDETVALERGNKK